MMIRPKRNWNQYNEKLKNIGRIDFFISDDAITSWNFIEKRKPGGKQIYSNLAIEMALLMKEFYQLAYRQTEGLFQSIFKLIALPLQVPNYTTLSRRAKNITIALRCKEIRDKNDGIVIAIDSTGLSLHSSSEWLKEKHGSKVLSPNKKWRKLHICIDVNTGEILDSSYTEANVNDGEVLPKMLENIKDKITSVCADMAYDTINCRKAIMLKEAKQIIPPKRNARLAIDNRNMKLEQKAILKERDDAINFIRYNTINDDKSTARKSWKEKVCYHARSLVETTMNQIKIHTSDKLTNRREDTRRTQSFIKCKVVNLIMAA